jgi:hypothetical protein
MRDALFGLVLAGYAVYFAIALFAHIVSSAIRGHP